MICVQLNGGLGNQMFQYACGRALAHKHQTELVLDLSQLTTRHIDLGVTFRSFEIDIFSLNAQEANPCDLKKLKPIIYRAANVLALRSGFGGIRTSKYFIEKKKSFNISIDKVGKDCFLSGYWQSYKYFQDIENIIRKEFVFPQVLDKENSDRKIKINAENSISLHIRRSDFVNNKYHDIHGTCSIDYYKKATEFVAEKINSPFFFIFSDDIEWAQENLMLAHPYEIVPGNTGKQSFIDMQLMSQCKHNIIANSSFSWWGAWLNLNSNKIVIAPKQWFTDELRNAQTKDLIPETWIRL